MFSNLLLLVLSVHVYLFSVSCFDVSFAIFISFKTVFMVLVVSSFRSLSHVILNLVANVQSAHSSVLELNLTSYSSILVQMCCNPSSLFVFLPSKGYKNTPYLCKHPHFKSIVSSHFRILTHEYICMLSKTT